jgi:hypothetical protein
MLLNNSKWYPPNKAKAMYSIFSGKHGFLILGHLIKTITLPSTQNPNLLSAGIEQSTNHESETLHRQSIGNGTSEVPMF